MRRAPPIVPAEHDQDVYLVLYDFGDLGRAWRETDENSTDRTTVVQDLLDGQYYNPVRVITFNAAEGWSRDVSEEIADALLQACSNEDRDVPVALEEFIDQHRIPAAAQHGRS